MLSSNKNIKFEATRISKPMIITHGSVVDKNEPRKSIDMIVSAQDVNMLIPQSSRGKRKQKSIGKPAKLDTSYFKNNSAVPNTSDKMSARLSAKISSTKSKSSTKVNENKSSLVMLPHKEEPSQF